MDSNGKDYVSDKSDVKSNALSDVDSKTTSLLDADRKDEEEDETTTLLVPPRRGGLSRKVEKSQRKVMWNDNNGNKLAQVLEYQPSDVSDSDEEESDSCFCRIM
ncbi:uncharacterized protein LOC141679007 [Apium graveolens]|uniref:uncharacterized protein LOC141679007 n=1 Tax=Apium graveolens TaxID=4045 RepID=UPI003D79010D